MINQIIAENFIPLKFPYQVVKKSWPVLFFVFAIMQLTAQVPTKDTVSLYQWAADTSSWIYKMEQPDDRWSRIVGRKDFQLFHREDVAGHLKEHKISASISSYGDATLFWLNELPYVEVAAAGVTPENSGKFIYHVIVNDSAEIVPWSKPANFRTNKHMTYAYLGKFDTQNKIVKIEFYNTADYKNKITWVLNGLYMPPASVTMLALAYNNEYLFKPFKQEYIPYIKDHYFPRDRDHKETIRFNWSDSISHVRISMKNTVQNDMYNVYLKRTINGKSDTMFISNKWTITYYSHDPELYVNASYFNKPGSYEIIVVPEAPDDFKINSMDKAVAVSFTVLPANTRLFSMVQLLMIVAFVILVAVSLFLLYYFISRRRAAKAARHKEMAIMELQSVRSQLNPHFMFNALAGIQNLMNKGDIDATNNYLSRFSRITRNVLDDKNKELITINEEVNLLEDYLQMEQMRFGFSYDIHVDEKIDRVNTEIPSILLQPYIENAVKHGVSSLKHAGIVAIAILLKSGCIVMEIKDNGAGYGTHTKPGNGTVLSQKRVDLINQINRNNTIIISKRSDLSGTTISIALNNWV